MGKSITSFQKGSTPWITGKSHSLESRQKMSIALKGRTVWNKGISVTEEHREKLRLARLGKKHSLETKLKMSLAQKAITNTGRFKKGLIPWSKGLHIWENKEHPRGTLGTKQSEETKIKRGIYIKGENHASWKGGEVVLNCKQCSKEYKVYPYRKDKTGFCSYECAGRNRIGEKSGLWKGGITPENHKIRMSFEMKQWRASVFERDRYTCIWCKQVGGQLNADHILPFAKFPEWRFELNNGRTLCVPCHRTTRTYGGKTRILTNATI